MLPYQRRHCRRKEHLPVIPAQKDKVWPLLVAEVGLNYPVQAIEKDSGLLTTQFVQMPVGFNNIGMERYVFPPGGFLATWAGLRMNMRIMAIESEPGKTMVTINAHYEAFESNVSKSWIVARSNGSVENQILNSIEQKLGLIEKNSSLIDSGDISQPENWTGITVNDELVVVLVNQHSPVYTKIKKGDKILEINRKPIRNRYTYYGVIQEHKGSKLLFLISRNGNMFFITVSAN